jgi:bifunctional ADP-heptose synthase (sugar kinase/adenylyltransferase)
MKLLVIGDSCIDIFRYGEVKRLAPEAPIPILVPEYESFNDGMSGNVVNNLKALGADVESITNKSEIRKIRYVCSKYNHLLIRIDEKDTCENIKDSYNLESIEWSKFDAVVISDYCKGFLNEDDIEFILKSHPLTFIDTKKKFGNWINEATFIKINHQEWERNEEIIDNKFIHKTIITKGKNGCEFNKKKYLTKEVPVKDLSGAGDTFLAGLVYKYVITGDISCSINFAQECTTIVVQKVGVATI